MKVFLVTICVVCAFLILYQIYLEFIVGRNLEELRKASRKFREAIQEHKPILYIRKLYGRLEDAIDRCEETEDPKALCLIRKSSQSLLNRAYENAPARCDN